jgi:hypothetical protein
VLVQEPSVRKFQSSSPGSPGRSDCQSPHPKAREVQTGTGRGWKWQVLAKRPAQGTLEAEAAEIPPGNCLNPLHRSLQIRLPCFPVFFTNHEVGDDCTLRQVPYCLPASISILPCERINVSAYSQRPRHFIVRKPSPNEAQARVERHAAHRSSYWTARFLNTAQ